MHVLQTGYSKPGFSPQERRITTFVGTFLGKALALGHVNFILRMAGVYRVNGKRVAIAISTASDAEALFSACID